ncbi:MAG: GTP-binding protein, partial [Candidatus Hydrogenedentes bacterium]|nr:GTP-binding protein [Candidatus Hydrogenedentota bacterium]
MKIPQERIRNFCIIAHIDHGKSTLADRLLEFTHTVEQRDMKEQTLDTMDIERERGITIKSVAVRMEYPAEDGQTYMLNLIDTPGHVDFAYEVSRSMAACEGALLLVDAAQGVEAQTLANAYKAIEQELEIIPVINKIDLPAADVESAKRQIEDVIGLPAEEAIQVSAKSGLGSKDVLEAIVHGVPAPTGAKDVPLRALIFDAVYNSYRGVIVYVRIAEGSIRKGQRVSMMTTRARYEVVEVGSLAPDLVARDELTAGEVGYLICNIKTLADTQIGDTVTDTDKPAESPLPGYQEVKPVVFSGLYPAASND